MPTYKVTTYAEVRRVYYIEAKDPTAAVESIEGRYPGEQETISETVRSIEPDVSEASQDKGGGQI